MPSEIRRRKPVAGREQKRKQAQVGKRIRLRDEEYCVWIRPEFKRNNVCIDTHFIITEKSVGTWNGAVTLLDGRVTLYENISISHVKNV